MSDVVISWLVSYGPLIVLPIFMLIFLAFGFWAYRPTNKVRMQHYADIPLQEHNDGD